MADLCKAINGSCEDQCKLIEVRSICTVLKISLNPKKDKFLDSEILKSLDELCNNPDYEEFKRLETLIQKLLKYDWERAKFETRRLYVPWFIPVAIIIAWTGFELFLKPSGIYDGLQSIKYLSGNYSLLLNYILFVTTILVLLFGTKYIPYFIKSFKFKSSHDKQY